MTMVYLLIRIGVEEADEYCPYCDNHYVIEAVEPTPVLMVERDEGRLDPRIWAKPIDILEDELLELMST